jgi:hypothetical protein
MLAGACLALSEVHAEQARIAVHEQPTDDAWEDDDGDTSDVVGVLDSGVPRPTCYWTPATVHLQRQTEIPHKAFAPHEEKTLARIPS